MLSNIQLHMKQPVRKRTFKCKGATVSGEEQSHKIHVCPMFIYSFNHSFKTFPSRHPLKGAPCKKDSSFRIACRVPVQYDTQTQRKTLPGRCPDYSENSLPYMAHFRPEVAFCSTPKATISTKHHQSAKKQSANTRYFLQPLHI